MRRQCVAGNWKMHGDAQSATSLLKALSVGFASLDNTDCIVFPPFPYLMSVANEIGTSSIRLGAQNVSEHQTGAYTGEVSPNMLKDCGCKYVLVGHSERRKLYKEDSESISHKFVAAQCAGLTPILCVGETQEQRDKKKTESVLAEQLNAVIKIAGVEAFNHALVAYEPVWAIGTGQTATPEQAQSTHLFIREIFRKMDNKLANELRILYGGSLKANNAKALFALPDIDGGLVGGASLDAQEFIKIGQLCNN